MYASDLSASPTEEEHKEEAEDEDDAAPTSEPYADAASDTANNDFAHPNSADFNAIPIIDLSQPKHVYAQQIGDACRNVGFFYIINHGVDQDVMEGVMKQSKKFFGLDLESKLQVSNEGSGGNKKGYRGYFGIGGENLENKDGTRDLNAEEGKTTGKQNATTKKMAGDFKEGFDCGLEISDENDARIKFFGKNLWPDERDNSSIIGFRETLMKYQAELIRLSDKLLLALALSLNENPNAGDVMVDEKYFLNGSGNPMCTLRLLHYPPTNGCDTASQGCGSHTDYGLFTILQQDSIGGLQVRNHHKHWIDAKPLKGSFVINVGDMLSHWTSSEYSSTVHRVISPSVSGDRYSLPFFFNPDHDALVKPLKSMMDTIDGVVDTDQVDARAALDILKARYAGTFQKSK